MREGRESKQQLHCGKFADLLTEDCGTSSLAYFGVRIEPCNARDRSAWATPEDLRRRGADNATRELMNAVREDDVYATVDFDVLGCKKENVRVASEWGTVGLMQLDELLASIKAVRQNKEIFAADVVGYSSLEWLDNGKRDEREVLRTRKSCLAAAAVAGEIMGLDNYRAMQLVYQTDCEIEKYDSYGERAKRFFGSVRRSLSGPW